MTATTNGASLEDCLTNIFSLIDTDGLRWKRFKLKESNNYLYTPIDTHPILTTYAKCIEENHIAAWRSEPQRRPHTLATGGHSSSAAGNAGSNSHSNFPTPTRASNNNTPNSANPSNSHNISNTSTGAGNAPTTPAAGLNANQQNYELIIFGYGNQLKVDNVIGDDLIETEDDTYEARGLSYECRTLLFKALHNLIERNLISKGYTKLGRWFVQPDTVTSTKSAVTTAFASISSTSATNSTSTLSPPAPPNQPSAPSWLPTHEASRNLSFSFSFFLHGDSTVCSTVDVRQHPTIYPLSKWDLASYQEGGVVRVVLAPHGLNGILNGVSFKDSDNGVAATTLIQQWSRFFPLPKSIASLSQLMNESTEVPPVVEVIVAGQRLRYPSECVFTTSKPSADSHESRTCSRIRVPAAASTVAATTTSTANNQTSAIKRASKSPAKPVTKIFPTPPSLDQVILSPPKTNEKLETKESSTFSPETMNRGLNEIKSDTNTISNSIIGSINNNNNTIVNNHVSRYNSKYKNMTKTYKDTDKIDVYKPVECALMPPPPKWAALTNIIPSSNSLPPDCIYKGSSVSKSSKEYHGLNGISIGNNNSTSQVKNSTGGAKLQPFNRDSHYKLISSQLSPAAPLTDQTNKNGFNISPHKSSSVGTSLLNPNHSNSNHHQQQALSSLTCNKAPMVTSTSLVTTSSFVNPLIGSTSSLFSYPNQILFSNLNEINPVQLNLILSDSPLSLLLDHNFESCTLCVCNMSIKDSQLDCLPQAGVNSGSGASSWKLPTPGMIGTDILLNNSKESVNECTCGFNALVTRHSSHLAGLFFEDELEITNVLYDPTELIDQNKLFRNVRLSNYRESAYQDEQRLMNKLLAEPLAQSIKSIEDSSKTKTSDATTKQTKDLIDEETRILVIDQLKQQCYTTIHSNSSLTKVILTESFRNNRLLVSCTNYYAQPSRKTNLGSSIYRLLDDSHQYTTVKMLNRNPISLKFSDLCELTRNLIQKLANQSSGTGANVRATSSTLVQKSLPNGSQSASSNLTAIFSRMFGSSQQGGKLANDLGGNNRGNVFIQGLQALVMPTLLIDPKRALQILESLVKDESKEALTTLNKAILMFTSPLHDWQFVSSPMPENNLDIANILKSIQPILFESIGNPNKLYKDFVHEREQTLFSARDSPTGAPVVPTLPCQGPLTWRQFHQGAGRGAEDQCEPQPIPSLLVGHHVERSHLAISPFALKFWDKLLLEPYAPEHNIYYTIVAPDSSNVLTHIEAFFKELSNMYELMKLGKHCPIGNGLAVAESTTSGNNELLKNNGDNGNDNGLFSKLAASDRCLAGNIIAQLKNYTSKLNANLAKSIVEFLEDRQPPYDPHNDRFDSSPNPHSHNQQRKPTQKASGLRPTFQTQPTTASGTLSQMSFNYPLLNSQAQSQNQNQTDAAMSQQGENASGYSNENHSGLTQNPQQQSIGNNLIKSQSLIGSSVHGTADENAYPEEEWNKQTGIVIYIIDPFASLSINHNLRTFATIGLIKCYSAFLKLLPEHVRRLTQLQLISLDSLINHSRAMVNMTRYDQFKSLSMNVYAKCRRILTNQATAKTLTGFGPSAALDAFFKTKSPEHCLAKVFTPPYILAPTKDKQTELGEMFGDRREKSSVMFCSYCITEDQRWLLASLTNDRGEMSETAVININVVDRMKAPKVSVKRIALRKLMDFIISVMSEWVNPWRLIIGKLGRLGHGELREWSSLMSKRSLMNYSRQLAEKCRQCTMLPTTETVSILSACLVSLEPDTKLRIMPDQFTSDDRQASFNKCPLNTPEDASATHILVFPTSASIQGPHNNMEDPLAGSGLDDGMLNDFQLDDGLGVEDLGVDDNIDDFLCWDPTANSSMDQINSHNDPLMGSSNMPGMASGTAGDQANQQDETTQLLQQPLALGFYISTAKIGQMPNWFWSSCPHLRNSCPVFLKSALHIHAPCVQLSDDFLHSNVGHNRKSHQLDSGLTTDILRYVLEGYNSLSWLALNPKTYDRLSCLPVHMQNLLQLYHLMQSFS